MHNTNEILGFGKEILGYELCDWLFSIYVKLYYSLYEHFNDNQVKQPSISLPRSESI